MGRFSFMLRSRETIVTSLMPSKSHRKVVGGKSFGGNELLLLANGQGPMKLPDGGKCENTKMKGLTIPQMERSTFQISHKHEHFLGGRAHRKEQFVSHC